MRVKGFMAEMYDSMLASIENVTIKDLVTQERSQKEGTVNHI